MKLLRIVTIISLFSVGIAQARLVFTTIDSPGFYRLSDELDNSVTVEVSDVTFDLNGHTITADTGIIINPGLDSVTIMNGTIQATTDGVISYTGSTGITLDNVRVEGAMRGITFDGVTGGLIKNCEMTMNTTGLLLDASHKITVKDCIANCNTHAGYDLLSSTTNCFENCKALSTGEGNTDIDSTTVFGFVSDSGYGNIFERCIANSTQALSVTGSSSLIAGFALRGSEGCTKIIDSESANTQTNVSGFTVPYGILLENYFDSTQTVTGALGFGTVTGVDWSSDGKYVAVSGSNIVAKEAGGDDLIPTLVQIYSFDRERGDFSSLTKALITSGTVNKIAWSPSGEYLALQFSGELQVYSFDKVSRELSLFSSVSISTGDQQDIAWSFDERFIAVAGDDGFVIYLFDRISGQLEETANGFDAVNAISFTPDGRYVAIGTATGSGTQLYVIEINPTTGTIFFPFISELGAFADIRSVDWSPDGHYLVVGGANIITSEGNGVEVFQHDRDAETLTNVVGDLVTTGTIYSADWSPDGQYIAVGGSSIGSGTGDDFQILEFDRAAQTLQVRDGALGVSSFIFDTKWSPDGQYIAVGGLGITGGSGDLFQIMTGLQFPSKNVITGNTVYCNSGNQFPNGVGISGSSIANMIIGNTAFNNPLATAKDKPIVGSNYQFGTNTFNQLFGQSPGDTQNISLDGCDPLCTPDDIPMLLRKILNNSNACAPTAIKTAGTISTSGIYCLANEISGAITISVSNVDLDLNNYRVTSGVIVNGGLDQVKIRNGVVEGSTDAILVNGGTTNVTLEDVVVKNAIRGINFDNVTGGLIKNCEMTMNTTGLELDNSHKITIDNSIANCNTHAGFDLLSSTTCLIQNCKALSTGEGNNDTSDTTVFGFASTSGYGNIFERCIANSTQALNATDSDSLIAGFALRGSEGCTKIIDSEAANSQTNESGFSVPYGILLEDSLDTTQSITGALIGDVVLTDTGQVFEVDWSPDGKYVAVSGLNLSGGTEDDVQLFNFDHAEGTLKAISGFNPGSPGSGVAEWSSDGSYLALAKNSQGLGLTILKFDRVNDSLSQVAFQASSQALFGGSWSFDDQYIAVANLFLTGDPGALQVFEFDKVSQNLTQVAETLNDGFIQVGIIVEWSPDGEYIAFGGNSITGGTADQFQIFRFDRGSRSLISITGALSGSVTAVSWSADGKYVAVGGEGLTGGTGDEFQIFEFDRAAGSLTSIAGALSGNVTDVSWSPNGEYIAVSGRSLTGGTGDDYQIFRFDPSAGTLTSISGALSTSTIIQTVAWSPDGQSIAIGGQNISGGTDSPFQIFSGMQFPQKNVIKGNTVYCNSGGQCPAGVGISGSSIANMIIGNTSYSNPIPRGENAPIVGSNYYFATNVFNPLFCQVPSDIQNISLDGCRPICTPEDIALLVKQTLYKVCTPIPSQLDVIESQIDSLGECGPTPISSDDVSGGVLTLSDSGNYCLTEDITANVFITGTDITFDLNQREVTGTFTLQSFLGSIPNQVAVKNGAILAPGPAAAATPQDPPAAAVSIAVTGALIENVSILCVNSDTNFPGRSGIEVAITGPVSIKDCAIQSGAAGLNPQTVDGLDGGHGIWLRSGREVFIDGCIIETGSGGRTANVASAIAGNGGSGVLVDGSVSIVNITDTTVVATGDGGEGGGSSNTGGEGGHGIAAQGTASEVSVQNCTILSTGDGGAGTGTTSTGGDAGHGVFIASTASDVSVRNCTIQQTGDGGTGTSTAGAPGKAIDDDVTTTASLSQIFANFAHNIANSTKFDLQAAGEAGILTPNPPTATVINPFANVYSS